jgi:hypothetical protein
MGVARIWGRSDGPTLGRKQQQYARVEGEADFGCESDAREKAPFFDSGNAFAGNTHPGREYVS